MKSFRTTNEIPGLRIDISTTFYLGDGVSLERAQVALTNAYGAAFAELTRRIEEEQS